MSHRPLPGAFAGRLWENGEFGYSKVREMIPEPFCLNPDFTDYNSWVDENGSRHLTPENDRLRQRERAASALGSSHHSNSHSPKARARRGLKGITSHGRKLVRNACYRLRSFVSQRRLSLLTLTVPGCSAAELENIASQWSELLRIFLQRLRRHLKAAGLPGEVVGVSEIQEKRAESSGLPVLHLHAVFVGRRAGCSWGVSPSQVNLWWSELLQPFLPDCTDWSAVQRIETVKKNVENYLGKYMTKGVQAISKIVENGGASFLPSSWYVCTNSLRRSVKSAIRTGFKVGETLAQLVESGNRSLFKYVYDVKIGNETDGEVCIGKHGRFIEGVYRDTCDYLDKCATLAP